MTKDEALKMAELALDINDDCECGHSEYQIGKLTEALNACKEALDIANCDIKQPAQEPVAWQWLKSGHMRKKIPKTATPEHWRPLYTHPHQWQGLTDDEIKQTIRKAIGINLIDITLEELVITRAIEQALKEKNT